MCDCLLSINLPPRCSLRIRNLGFSNSFEVPKYLRFSVLESKSSLISINSARFGDAIPYPSDEHEFEDLDFGDLKDRELRLRRDEKGKSDELETAKGGLDDEAAEDLSVGDIFEFRDQKKDNELMREDNIAKPREIDSNLGELERRKYVGTIDGSNIRRQMLRRSNVMAKQVISIRSALSLGFVSQLWVDTNSWGVIIVEVKPNLLSGDSDWFLLKEITQVGDVILVQDENVIGDDLKLVGLETLVGYTVVTPRHLCIGKVRGYTFNINSGMVESLELDSFGISIIPSSLVSTYALFVDDVVEVYGDTVVVSDAAVSRMQRLTKGFWGSQNAGNEFEERLDVDGRQGYAGKGKQRRSRKSRPKKRKSLDDWELPMDFL